jgi:hypothetical protein
MMFTFRNACSATKKIRLRLFDKTANLIYLDDMHDYVITSAPVTISILCNPGNKICYGGVDGGATPTPSRTATRSRTPTPTSTPGPFSTPPRSGTPAPSRAPLPSHTPLPSVNTWGVGINNDQACDTCCFTCKDATIPAIDLRCPSP